MEILLYFYFGYFALLTSMWAVGNGAATFSTTPATCTTTSSNIKHKATVRDITDPLCIATSCPTHSICYLGACVCIPGYGGVGCASKLNPANPWYSTHCPNLQQENTLNLQVPLNQIGGEFRMVDGRLTRNKEFCEGHNNSTLLACAYLCYSHPDYGAAIVPKALWKDAQGVEQELWVEEGKHMRVNANDRSVEHWAAFDGFKVLPAHNLTQFGNVLEVGAGPWTQFRYILHFRPEIIVKHFTIWEPSASKYMESVTSCSYKDGKSLRKFSSEGVMYHQFPVSVVSKPGERMDSSSTTNAFSKTSTVLNTNNQAIPTSFDTLISINVLEHVQDAFHYLSNLYTTLQKGGILIFHERYYEDSMVSHGDRYHPIRIKQSVLDHFLNGFDILFNNCSAAYDGRRDDRGYYVIARKR